MSADCLMTSLQGHGHYCEIPGPGLPVIVYKWKHVLEQLVKNRIIIRGSLIVSRQPEPTRWSVLDQDINCKQKLWSFRCWTDFLFYFFLLHFYMQISVYPDYPNHNHKDSKYTLVVSATLSVDGFLLCSVIHDFAVKFIKTVFLLFQWINNGSFSPARYFFFFCINFFQIISIWV